MGRASDRGSARVRRRRRPVVGVGPVDRRDRSRARHEQASALIDLAQWERAARVLKRRLASWPEDAEALAMLALCGQSLGDAVGALRAAGAAAAVDRASE